MTTYKQYLHHLKELHYGIRMEKCWKCDQLFEKEKELYTHNYQIHRKKRDPNCMAHLRKKPEDKWKQMPKICDICGVNAKNPTQHFKYYHEVDETVCQECGHVSQNKYKHQHHIKAKHNLTPCTECGKMFSTGQLKKHIDSAHRSIWDRRHKCDICGKSFSDTKTLRDHMNVHTGAKPYECKVCHHRFASSANMYACMRAHKGIKRRK